MRVFQAGCGGQVLLGEEAHLLEGVFKQCLPGNVDLDMAGQSVGLWGRRSVAQRYKGNLTSLLSMWTRVSNWS